MFDLRLMMSDRTQPRSACAPGTSSIINHQSHIFPKSAFRTPHSAFPNALTLIELLVVIVILTTLVAGVIPILSPNNDSRKIREASRMLQSYIMMTQAEAARTGRPQGIAFQESSAGSGVALEVFQLEVPVPFAGFSSASMARIVREETAPGTFTFYVQFVLSDSPTGNSWPPTSFPPDDFSEDPMPPKLIRYLDEVHIAGTRYQFVDEDFDGDGSDDPVTSDPFYTLDNGDHTRWTFQCNVVNDVGQTLAFVKTFTAGLAEYKLTAPKMYKIIRQPTNSVRAPLQLPAGVAIDLQASGTESTAGMALFDATSAQDTAGIMFSPSGAVESVYFTNSKMIDMSRVFLLLGRVENSSPTNIDLTGLTGERLATRQAEVNWLNLDSRWIMIAARSGRAVVSENAFVDAPEITAMGGDPTLAEDQIEAAHEFAHEMKREGGR